MKDKSITNKGKVDYGICNTLAYNKYGKVVGFVSIAYKCTVFLSVNFGLYMEINDNLM